MLNLIRILRLVIPLLVFYVVWQSIRAAPEGSRTPGLFWHLVPFVLVGGAVELLLLWLEKRLTTKR
jgi:hypothetical protein